MKQTANYRQGVERFVPSPSEIVLLAALVIFCWKMYGGTSNSAIAGMSSVTVIALAWVLGVALRAALNDMRWWLLLGFLVALIVPWMGINTFQVGLMSQVCVFALMIFGLNVVTGYTGQISIGHGALVGISAYTMAVLMHHWSWPVVPAALVAIATTTAFGFLLGIPALRLAGPYLAIATLAAALIFPLVVKLNSVQNYTGGGQGITEQRISPPSSIDSFLQKHAPSGAYQNDFQKKKFSHEAYLYYITLVTAIIGTYGAWNLGRSRFGRAFIAVRDREVAATSMGVNVALYKVTAFGISAIYAGISGVMFFLVISFVAPESFDLFNLSVNPLAFMVIGGLASTGGSIIGAFGYMWVPQVIQRIATINADFNQLQAAMTGLLLIVVMTRLPQGVWGVVTLINGLSWGALVQQTERSVRTRPIGFWVGVVVGAAAVVLVALFVGTVWAVFSACLLVVAPADSWTFLVAIIRRPLASLRRNTGGEGPGSSPAPADV